nr:MAG TPA: hypothetical protein [Bacteriophage sp.]
MPPPGISTFARLIYKSFCNILIMCYFCLHLISNKKYCLLYIYNNMYFFFN